MESLNEDSKQTQRYHMNKTLKWTLVGVGCVGLAAVLGVRTFMPRVNEELKDEVVKQPQAPKLGRTLNVQAVVLNRVLLADELFVSGNVMPDEEVSLAFETSGKVTEILFQEGSFVRKGDLLAKINDEPLQAELRKQEAQLKLFQDRMFRQNALLEKEAVSEEAFQEAQANLAGLHAEIDRVKANIGQKELRAPFDGVLGLREVSLGAYVSPTTPIVKLTKMNPLKIEFSVPERYSGILKAGARLDFTVEGDLDERSAKVYATDSRVDMDTRTFTVRALYDNSDGALFPGRYVNVNLLTREYPDAIAIPSEAIISEMGHDKVFLYRGGKAESVIITKGIRNDALVQVVQGLEVGDTVITTGTMQLREGQKVVLDAIK